MIRVKNETKNSLLSLSKNSETPIKQTHRKAVETLEFKMTKPKEAFHFNPSIQIDDGSWMVGLISLKLYNSIFNIAEQNNKFEQYTENFDELSFEVFKDEL